MMFILNQFIRLVIFLSITPTHLPKRLEKLKNTLSDDSTSGFIYVDIHGFDEDTVFALIKLTDIELGRIIKDLQQKVDRGEYKIMQEEGTRYLLTNIRRCCGAPLKCKYTDGTECTMFTTTGVVSAICFTFTCQKCHKRYFPSYHEENVNGQIKRTYVKRSEETRDKPAETEAFHITNKTFFSLEFLRCLTYDIVITHTEFTNFCAAYNEKYSVECKRDLQDRRLLDVFFLYHLNKRLKLSFIVPRDGWRAINTEPICDEYYPALKESVDFRWLRHTCTSSGCLRRVVILDGDQKLFRTRCAAMGEQVVLESGELQPIRACPQNPLPEKSFCASHIDGQTAKAPVEQTDIRRVTRNTVNRLGLEIEELTTSLDGNGEGCRPKDNITTNSANREVTCGMLYFFRDCFIRLGHAEMLTSESCTIIVLALVDLFGVYPARNLIIGLAFDRACELSPFMRNKGVRGNIVMLFWSLMSMVVDKFHVGGHKRPECQLDHPLCKFHPDHASNSSIWSGVNTGVAEQSFRELNKTKHTTRYMSRARRMVYFKVLDDEFNMILERKMKRLGKLILAGSDVTYEESRRNAQDKSTPPEDFIRRYGGQDTAATDENVDDDLVSLNEDTSSTDENMDDELVSEDMEFASQESMSSNLSCKVCGFVSKTLQECLNHFEIHF